MSPSGRTRAAYHPQFAFPPTPRGFVDVDFEAYFDAVSTPVLGITLAAGAEQLDVPLQLENDADFIVRGIRIVGAAQFQFKTPDGIPLSSRFPAQPPVLQQSYQAGGLNLTPSGVFELPTVPMDPEVVCPAGSAWLLNVLNPAAIPTAVAGFIVFFGVKRYAQ